MKDSRCHSMGMKDMHKRTESGKYKGRVNLLRLPFGKVGPAITNSLLQRTIDG